MSKVGAAWGRMIGPFLGSMKVRLGPRNRMMLNLVDRECQRAGARLAYCNDYLRLTLGNREMRLSPRHFVYAYEMAERFDTYFSPLVPFEEDGRLVLDYSRPGILQTYAGSGLQFEMASFPEEDEAIESYFRWYKPGAGDTVFDIGAHCGVSAYHFSRLVGPSGRVIAFEPDPTNFGLLLRNLERHNLTNVTPVQAAIAATRGQAPFHCEASIGSGLARQSTRPSIGEVKMVDTLTLEDVFSRWAEPQFCKIDIEGTELEVIESSGELLQRSRCHFALDTNHMVGGDLTDKRIEAMFRANGYKAESSTEGMKTTWAGRV